MKITELLITGFDGDKPVLVVSVFPEVAKAILTTADDDGQPTVEVATERATRIFGPMQRMLEGFMVVSP
jgi:hypothetical protein